MRRISTGKALSDLRGAIEVIERKLYQLMDVIDAKDAIIDRQMKEIAELKKEIDDLKGVKSLWNEVEE